MPYVCYVNEKWGIYSILPARASVASFFHDTVEAQEAVRLAKFAELQTASPARSVEEEEPPKPAKPRRPGARYEYHHLTVSSYGLAVSSYGLAITTALNAAAKEDGWRLVNIVPVEGERALILVLERRVW